VVTITSLAGLVGGELTAAYATSKFALEGWMESLHHDLAPYGISTTIVEPGMFRTELLEETSTIWPELSIDDYAQRTATLKPMWQGMNGRQAGDPAKLAAALMELLDLAQPPERWVAGADPIGAVEQKAEQLLAQLDAHREVSCSLAHSDARA
jgi:NAD(P)-dependent dehydrogenase (short-subunit alcohol dehydrogenase family)